MGRRITKRVIHLFVVLNLDQGTYGEKSQTKEEIFKI